jgi:hypothetical protein
MQNTGHWNDRQMINTHTHTHRIQRVNMKMCQRHGIEGYTQIQKLWAIYLIRNSKQKKKTCLLIEVTIPSDRNVAQREAEKKLKYKTLCIEIQWMCHMKCMIVAVIMAATGIVTKAWSLKLEAWTVGIACFKRSARKKGPVTRDNVLIIIIMMMMIIIIII